MYARNAKGRLLDSGASGILEILPSGDVIKSPWPDLSEADSRRDLTIESEIYKRLASHPRLLKIIDWSPEDCSLTMEYMPNGNLQVFLLNNNNATLTITQQLRWVEQAAEGLQLLHSANVLYCDVNPKNFLLDADLGLKIVDFGGSSLAGSKPSAYSEARFSVPKKDWRHPPTVQDDLFALGTTIYFTMTCQLPFPELSDEEVEENYRKRRFPDVSKIFCGQLIEQCWTSQIGSAQDVYDFIRSII